MLNMENTYKGIAWFGNIYKKFEDICLEIDDFMSQEGSKKDEIQLQTVDANVKLICSDLMQDVLPPSPDGTVKVAVPNFFDFSLEQAVDVCEKSDSSVTEDPIKKKQLQLEVSAIDSQVEILLPAPDDVTGCNSSMGTEEGSCNLVDASASVSSPVPSSSSVTLIISCDSKVPDAKIVPGGAFVESIQRSDDSIAQEARDTDVTKPCMKIVHSSDKVKLDESCIVVDCNEFSLVSRKKPKRRSYKEKILEAVASETRLRKKQDYKQNASWYGDVDTGRNQQNVQIYASSALAKSSNSLDHEFCESDWEII